MIMQSLLDAIFEKGRETKLVNSSKTLGCPLSQEYQELPGISS